MNAGNFALIYLAFFPPDHVRVAALPVFANIRQCPRLASAMHLLGRNYVSQGGPIHSGSRERGTKRNSTTPLK